LDILLNRPYNTFQHLREALRADPLNKELVNRMSCSDGNKATVPTVPKSNIGEFLSLN